MGLGKRFFGTEFGQAVGGYLAAQYIRLVRVTTAWKLINDQNLNDLLAKGIGVVVVTWHGNLMMSPVGWPGPKSLHALVSRHGDGEIFSNTMARFGMIMVRGSTHRKERSRDKGGAAALRKMVSLLKNGQSVAVTPDGPRGPARIVGSGVVTLARLSGAPIIPVSILTASHRQLRSWDGFRVPLPFSNGAIVFGEPIFVNAFLDKEGRETKRLEIEAALNSVTDKAKHQVGLVE